MHPAASQSVGLTGSLPWQFPDVETLASALTYVLASHGGHTFSKLTIIDRQPNARASTFPSEIVLCHLDDESTLQLFCKYEASGNHNAYGHRGGIRYEAEVYRRVLQPSQLPTPHFYGAYTDTTTGDIWLILEYLHKRAQANSGKAHVHIKDDVIRMKYKLGLAARWIGQFHAANEGTLANELMSFLNTYDAEYYLGWAHRVLLFAGELHKLYPWLTTVCKRYEQIVDLLLQPPMTIIHAEYYKHNILHLYGTAYPVDWESAAIAAGEIDLASLMERWPAEIADHCQFLYQQARWPEGLDPSFARRLDAARLYLQLRWLGDRPSWTAAQNYQWRFTELLVASERLGLI